MGSRVAALLGAGTRGAGPWWGPLSVRLGGA